MALVLVPLAEGFEDLEAISVTDLLRRAQIKVHTAGLRPGPVQGSRGTVVVPDMTLDQALQHQYDMLVLPGGQPGATHLENDERIRELIQSMAAANRQVAAICAASKVLASAGVLDDRKATGFPGSLSTDEFPRIRLTAEAVVHDGAVVTSRGPGTAMDFALKLIEILTNAETRNHVEQALQRP